VGTSGGPGEVGAGRGVHGRVSRGQGKIRCGGEPRWGGGGGGGGGGAGGGRGREGDGARGAGRSGTRQMYAAQAAGLWCRAREGRVVDSIGRRMLGLELSKAAGGGGGGKGIKGGRGLRRKGRGPLGRGTGTRAGTRAGTGREGAGWGKGWAKGWGKEWGGGRCRGA